METLSNPQSFFMVLLVKHSLGCGNGSGVQFKCFDPFMFTYFLIMENESASKGKIQYTHHTITFIPSFSEFIYPNSQDYLLLFF